MTEAQQIVLNWKSRLKAMGWPEENTREIVSELCEAGYRQCVDDIQARAAQTDALIAKVAMN